MSSRSTYVYWFAQSFLVLSGNLGFSVTWACDLCAVYNAIETQRGEAGALTLGVAHQFTYSSSGVKRDTLVNPENIKTQFLSSHVTQIYANYQLHERFGLQVNVPFITRHYRRAQFGDNERGTLSGLGDISVIGKVVPYQYLSEDLVVDTQLFAGAKLATGDASRLREELDEIIDLVEGRPLNLGSFVGGDDLALGTGSVDTILGTAFFLRYKAYFVSANVQYTLRQEGAFDFQFGDDLQWNVGPAWYVRLEHDHTVALRMRFSGEYKRNDEILGVELAGSDELNTFLGPEILFTYENRLFTRLAVELPVETDSAATTVVPQVRLLANVSWGF